MGALGEALITAQATGGEPPVWPWLIAVLITTLGPPLLALVHETGHALACAAFGVPVEQLRVGGEPHLRMRRGRFRLELSLRDDERRDGFVRFGEESLTARRLAVIALAGPAAELLLLAPIVIAATRAPLVVTLTLGWLAFLLILMVYGNVRPGGTLDDPASWNDGRIAQLAWIERHEPWEAPEPDPYAASAPPPVAPAPRPPVIRWPFAVVLGAVFAATVAIGQWQLVLALAALFGLTALKET